MNSKKISLIILPFLFPLGSLLYMYNYNGTAPFYNLIIMFIVSALVTLVISIKMIRNVVIRLIQVIILGIFLYLPAVGLLFNYIDWTGFPD
ncbi:hypothetical protein [Vallitalea okinawensis]|uniref:hypothetical protein n=1 Tax=Vallitalea okinawensis TaxID=2078660 RepID=UPI000CFC34EB|nr:hypothetical protein [Vallitalea okinawensis]